MSNIVKLTQQDLDNAFQTGEVFDAPDDVLIVYLRVLSTGAIPNEYVRHRETNRCITINTLITSRLAKRIDRSNTILAITAIGLAIVSFLASIIQILR